MYGAMLGRSDVEIKEHQIQGIGDGFIPDIVDMSKVDEVITVASTKAIDMARKLASKYGLFVGISSGANMLAALRVAETHNKVVTVLPDRGERYLSMNLQVPYAGCLPCSMETIVYGDLDNILAICYLMPMK